MLSKVLDLPSRDDVSVPGPPQWVHSGPTPYTGFHPMKNTLLSLAQYDQSNDPSQPAVNHWVRCDRNQINRKRISTFCSTIYVPNLSTNCFFSRRVPRFPRLCSEYFRTLLTVSIFLLIISMPMFSPFPSTSILISLQTRLFLPCGRRRRLFFKCLLKYYLHT